MNNKNVFWIILVVTPKSKFTPRRSNPLSSLVSWVGGHSTDGGTGMEMGIWRDTWAHIVMGLPDSEQLLVASAALARNTAVLPDLPAYGLSLSNSLAAGVAGKTQ